MKLSIITICYNNRQGLEKTLRSVCAQLTPEVEYIVIDGGSTDGSVDLIKQYADHITYWVSEPDKGIYNAMNKGIAVAKGEYVNFMNSGDCFVSDDIIARVLPRLQGKDFYVGDEMHKKQIVKAPDQVLFTRLAHHPLSHQSTFIHTGLLKKRPYKESYKIASDWEQMFYELIVQDASYERLPFIVANFDMTGISSSKSTNQIQQEETNRVRKSLLPSRIYQFVEGYGDKHLLKVIYALGYEDPLKRDLKLLRNSLKMLFRDLFKRK